MKAEHGEEPTDRGDPKTARSARQCCLDWGSVFLSSTSYPGVNEMSTFSIPVLMKTEYDYSFPSLSQFLTSKSYVK